MSSAHERQPAKWEHWWARLDGTPGELVWDADEADLATDLEVRRRMRSPPVGHRPGLWRQASDSLCARHFEDVIGVDISPAAIERALDLEAIEAYEALLGDYRLLRRDSDERTLARMPVTARRRARQLQNQIRELQAARWDGVIRRLRTAQTGVRR